MSVYRDKSRKTYQYDFWYAGKHHRGNTYQQIETDARLAEATLKLRLRQQRGGIAGPAPSPLIAEWAGVYFTHLVKVQTRTGRPKRLERIDEQLRVVLRFFGRAPTKADDPLQPIEGEEAPFHNCTLRDLIDEPDWLLKFDDWIDRRGVAGSTRNHYYSTMSRLYAVAMLPAYRKATGITINPFTGIPRARRVTRKVTLTPHLVRTWLGAMGYHARLAVSIAALAPKLRLRNILALDRVAHLDASVTRITMDDHKSDRITEAPLIVPVTAQLRTILLDAFGRMRPGTTRVVQYRGVPVDSIRGAIAGAAREVGIPYGRFRPGGVTFHTLRHTASTLFATLGVNPWAGRDAMGHEDMETTDGYTHLALEDQRVALESLSAALPIAAIVTRPGRRAARRTTATAGGPTGGPAAATHGNAQQSTSVTRGARAIVGRPFARKAQ